MATSTDSANGAPDVGSSGDRWALHIGNPHGLMNTFITHPEEEGPHPVVFFYMDAPGMREELHDMARRLGSAGYYVVVPKPYYRAVREFDATKHRAALGQQMQE